MTSPTFAVWPFAFKIWAIIPESGAGNSTVAFSLSRLTTGSSFSTWSPWFLSQAPISTSVIDSPTSGIFSSRGIVWNRDFYRHPSFGFNGKCSLDNLILFLFVASQRTGGRRGGGWASNAGKRELFKEVVAKAHTQMRPGAHIYRFFLDPKYGSSFVIYVEGRFQQVGRQRIKLLQTDEGYIL